MAVAERNKPQVQAQTDLGVAVGNMEASVREFSECLLARVSSDAAQLGRGPQVVAGGKRMIQMLANLTSELGKGMHDADPALGDLAKHVAGWIAQSDEALGKVDQFEFGYLSSSRDNRRALVRKYSMVQEVAITVRTIREKLLELYELLDPTPENYFEELVFSVHGDRAQSMISSFNTLSSSNNYSSDAFGRRHNLK